MRNEDKLAQQVATWLNIQHPTIIYHFDTGSGSRTSIGMAMRNKRLNKWRGYPDLFICKIMNGYGGLFIELKASSPFKKNGDVKSDVHLQEQLAIQNKLKEKGYWADFGCGFEDIIKLINWYLTPNGIFKNN